MIVGVAKMLKMHLKDKISEEKARNEILDDAGALFDIT